MKRWLLIGLAAVALLSAALVLLLESSWLRHRAARWIASSIDAATGARTEIGGLEFSLRRLEVSLDSLVIHGRETDAVEPLFRARRVSAALRLLRQGGVRLQLRQLSLTNPEISLRQLPGGTLNLPLPSGPARSRPLADAIDLAIGRLEATGGIARWNGVARPWNARGDEVAFRFFYVAADRMYAGRAGARLLTLERPSEPAIEAGFEAGVHLSPESVEIPAGRLTSGQSSVTFSARASTSLPASARADFEFLLAGEDLSRILSMPRWTGTLSGSGELRWAPPPGVSVTALLEASGLRSGRISVPSASAKLHWTGGRLEVPAFTLRSFDGSLRGEAAVEPSGLFRVRGNALGLGAKGLLNVLDADTGPLDGLLSGPVEVAGSLPGKALSALRSSARLTLSPRSGATPVNGVIDVTFDGRKGFIDFGSTSVATPNSSLRISGRLGNVLRLEVETKEPGEALALFGRGATLPPPIALAQGLARFQGTLTGPLSHPRLEGSVRVRNASWHGRIFETLEGEVSGDPGRVEIRSGVVRSGALRVSVSGSQLLQRWRPDLSGALVINAALRNAPLADIQAIAGLPQDASGLVSGSMRVSGTPTHPITEGQFAVVDGAYAGQPFSRVDTRVLYEGTLLRVVSLRAQAVGGQITLAAEYRHQPDEFLAGDLRVRGDAAGIRIEQLAEAAAREPRLAGVAAFSGDAAFDVSAEPGGEPRFQLKSVRANGAVSQVRLGAEEIGQARLRAESKGTTVTAELEAAAAGVRIEGKANCRLEANYPLEAEFRLADMRWTNLKKFLPLSEAAAALALDARADGTLRWSGLDGGLTNWQAEAALTRFEAVPTEAMAGAQGAMDLDFRNAGPILLSASPNAVRIREAHFAGKLTNLTLNGFLTLRPNRLLDLQTTGAVDLTLLRSFNRDLIASGKASLDAVIKGAIERPAINGKLDLKDAALALPDVPNGLSRVNGTVVFDGNRATIEELSAETGGGKLALTGFVGFGAREAVYRVQAEAAQVRVRYPEGVSTLANASLSLTGTSQKSLLAGKLTVLRSGINPRTDFGSLLSKSGEPSRPQTVRTGLLAGMQLDIQIESAPDLRVQSSLAQDIQAEANLRLRGSVSNPALLGRVAINHGEVNFFGTRYSISQGTVSFFNAARVEPILNVDLQTRVRGIDVTLTLSGPANKIALTHRSDPPLEFAEIVALLATGRTPTTDPALAARLATQPQSWQQMGAGSIIGQALTSPVSGRLQRLFGVSSIRIDPQIIGVDNNPQARLSVEQQITREITFTYITNLTRSNPQVVRVEWAINREWSAIATRDENGLLGVDFLYKRRFK